MVQYGVMESVYGATISVWNQEDQVINYKQTFTNIHFEGYPTCHSVYTALQMQMYFANSSPFKPFFQLIHVLLIMYLIAVEMKLKMWQQKLLNFVKLSVRTIHNVLIGPICLMKPNHVTWNLLKEVKCHHATMLHLDQSFVKMIVSI